MMGIYSIFVNKYGWSLKDIDDTDIETLIDFIYYKDNDPNVRVIDGVTYYRTVGVPTWL